jgi:hypothetical protein
MKQTVDQHKMCSRCQEFDNFSSTFTSRCGRQQHWRLGTPVQSTETHFHFCELATTATTNPFCASTTMAEDTLPAVAYPGGLPVEVRTIICKFLDEDKDGDSLAGLRQSCKAFELVTEPYLFSRIYLDTRIDSLEFMESLSQNTHLRQYVKSVSVELEHVFPTIDNKNWHMQRKGEVPCPRNHRAVRSHYVNQYADLYHDADTKQRRQFYREYCKASVKEQQMQYLVTSRKLDLLSRFIRAFSRFPQLIELECIRSASSKYVVRRPCYKIARSLLKTLAIPLFPPEAPGNGDQYTLAAAAQFAFFHNSPTPTKLSLQGVSSRF